MADQGFWDASFKDIENVIYSVSRKVANEYRLNWDQYGEDLVQAGWVGACRARGRYQVMGFKFITYAYSFVNGDIRRAAKFAVKHNNFDSDDVLLEIEALDDPTFDVWINDLLASPDGLELLANELNLRDSSKRGAVIRKEQLAKLKEKWELASAS